MKESSTSPAGSGPAVESVPSQAAGQLSWCHAVPSVPRVPPLEPPGAPEGGCAQGRDELDLL